MTDARLCTGTYAEGQRGDRGDDPTDDRSSFRVGRREGSGERAGVALFCALLWVGCLFLYTRANTFAYYYHPDEEGKAKQATLNSRNFNHPQMLLEVSSLVIRVTGAGKGMKKDLGENPAPARVEAQVRALQSATIAGRGVAAAFAAGAVVLLALAARRVAGPA